MSQRLLTSFDRHLHNKEVLSRTRKLPNASARVKRISRGIENVPSVSSQSAAEEDEEEEVPVAPSTSRNSRRTTRARAEEVQEVEPTSPDMRHSTGPPERTPRRQPGRCSAGLS
ncbi:hypothetical protein EJ03DRAFT_354375 [Teratosphaeria nubilosa]|uniref:Uncharacterized protein n=1 Tax=Teratosphaeria nubilosa TaxID=161662 RepID=A0A6G1KZ82_9PEZI|nr:hypothetical protein EJ03DRAFT_354375 [Teratosphaeria nubilosa]